MSQDWFTLKITAKHEDGQGIFVFELADPDDKALPAFTAGAHLEIKVGDMIRHYSLAGSPFIRSHYVLGVQRELSGRGGSIAFCDHYGVGQAVQVRGPNNHFSLVPGSSPYVLLAGGIGITPILSMAEELWAKGLPFEFHYAARTRSKMAFHDKLVAAPYSDSIFFHFDDGDEDQRLDLTKLLASPAPGRHFYFCGPPPMIDAAIAAAQAQGWSNDHVHYERFSGAVAEGENAPFTIEIKSTGQKVTVPADKTAIQALAEVGIEIPVSCEQGVCGTCLTKVVSGVPDHRDMYLMDDEREGNLVFMPCCSRAKSDILVLDL